MKSNLLTALAFAMVVGTQVTEAHDYEMFNHPHQSWNNHVSTHHTAHYQATNYRGRYLCGHRSLGTFAFGHYRNVCTGRWEYGHYERFAGHELQDNAATQTFHQYLHRSTPASHHCEQCRQSSSRSRVVAKRRTIGKTGKTLAQIVQSAKLRARIKYLQAKNERALARLRLAKQRKKAQELAAQKLAAEQKAKEVLAAEQVAETRKNDVPLHSKRLAVSIRLKKEVAPTTLVASNLK